LHVIQRVKRARLLNNIVVTVPINDLSVLGPIITDCGAAMHYRPEPEDENDLVKAYYEAAKAYDADVVVRVPADNPCVEPGEIDRLIEWSSKLNIHAMDCREQNIEPTGNNGYPDGIGAELYYLWQLKQLDRGQRDPCSREHLHLNFQAVGPMCPPEFARSDIRLDVNTQADYDKINDIYNHFGHNHFHITEVIKYLDVLAKRRAD